MEASWNSATLEALYKTFGWIAFFAWSFSFYPQVLLNYRRKSVVGLNFDFLVLNLTKHTSYLIYNAVPFFSPLVQRQYHDKYGSKEMIPVAENDVAFSIHAVALTSLALFQVFLYERGNQKVSKATMAITCSIWTSALACLILAWTKRALALAHYSVQAFMNFKRKSTEGWSIGNIFLDLNGAIFNFAQMGVQSTDQHSLVNFYGNIGKTLLSLEVVIFDLLFVIQHYVLYCPASTPLPTTCGLVVSQLSPLIRQVVELPDIKIGPSLALLIHLLIVSTS